MGPKVRFAGMDFMRCVAIVLLLWGHIAQTINNPIGYSFAGIPHFYSVSLGGLAVTIFLILSGAGLQLQYGTMNIGYLHFIARRSLRIYPIYYLSLSLGILIYFIRSYLHTGQFMTGFSELGIRDIALSITGGYAFAGEWGGPFVATSWFIALIMTMYIIFPFLSREIKKRPIVALGFLFLLSFLSRLIVGKYDILPKRPLEWFPLCRVFEFSLGIYSAVVLSKKSLNHMKLPRHLDSLISFISKISFPLFLIHYPLLLIIKYLMKQGVNQLPAICFFVLVSLTVSWVVLAVDNRLPRSRILKKLTMSAPPHSE